MDQSQDETSCSIEVTSTHTSGEPQDKSRSTFGTEKKTAYRWENTREKWVTTSTSNDVVTTVERRVTAADGSTRIFVYTEPVTGFSFLSVGALACGLYPVLFLHSRIWPITTLAQAAIIPTAVFALNRIPRGSSEFKRVYSLEDVTDLSDLLGLSTSSAFLRGLSTKRSHYNALGNPVYTQRFSAFTQFCMTILCSLALTPMFRIGELEAKVRLFGREALPNVDRYY